MTKSKEQLLGEALETEAAGLRDALRHPAALVVESSPEEGELRTFAHQQVLARLLCDRASWRLRDIEEALRRLEKGGFGAYEETGASEQTEGPSRAIFAA